MNCSDYVSVHEEINFDVIENGSADHRHVAYVMRATF